MKPIDKEKVVSEIERKLKNIKLPKKYETCDWLFIYHSVGLTAEHVKRLTNAINILKSIGEYTDAKFLKEIQDKLLEVKEMKEVIAEQECTCNKALNRIIGGSWNLLCPINKLGLKTGDKVKVIIKAQKGE